jgi:hypothetical protein
MTLLFFASGGVAAVAYSGEDSRLEASGATQQSGCEDFLKRNGIGDIRDCAVSESGLFGELRGVKYRYVLYCIIPAYSEGEDKCGGDSFTAQYHRQRGMAVYADNSSEENRLLMERVDPEIGVVLYEKPEIISNASGTFLYLPIRVDGTGAGNISEYYLWNEKTNGWDLIESEYWIKDLRQRLPDGLSIWKGIWPDLKTMSAKAGLYREGDANCCPSGGTAFMDLSVEEGRFRLKSVDFELTTAP